MTPSASASAYTHMGTAIWKFMEQVHMVAEANNGYFFGPYIRDHIRRTSAADLFNAGDEAAYEDRTLHPELADRFVVPEKMCIIMTNHKNLKSFLHELNATHQFIVVTKGTNTTNNNVYRFSATVSLAPLPWMGMHNPLKDFKIELDIVYSIEERTPDNILFDIEDKIFFECDGLIQGPTQDLQFHPLFPVGSPSAPKKAKLIKEAIDNICSKKAVKIQGTCESSTPCEFIDAGWTIVGSHSTLFQPPVGSECTICTGSFKKKGRHMAIQGRCCNAGFLHIDCCKKYITSKNNNITCMFCRADVNYDTL